MTCRPALAMIAACLIAVALPRPAAATNTLCNFDGGGYALEFIGYERIQMIQVNAPRGKVIGRYTVVDFDYAARRIHVVHARSADVDSLPSFTLQGSGDAVVMRTGKKAVKGVLRCQWQADA